MTIHEDLEALNEAETVAYAYGDSETARRLAQLAEELKISVEATIERTDSGVAS